MISLNTNISDLILQRTLLDSTFGLNEAINRMTTGFKVNHAKDNAAGYSIIENLNTKISSLLQVQQNAADGISLLSTAEGGLAEIQGLLERLRELTVQASTGTYDSKSRDAMQVEADALVEEINRIKNSIEYDGRNLYETPRNNAVARLAQSASINLSQDAGLMSLRRSTPLPASLDAEEDLITSSSSAFYSGVGVGVNSITPIQPSLSSEGVNEGENSGVQTFAMARSASLASATIDGSVDFAASETKTVTIDGVNYEVTNNNTTTNSLSYSKDTATGQITFMGSHFEIIGQDDATHNLLINGSNNSIYGANLADTIEVVSGCTQVSLYGQGGNDTLLANNNYVVNFYGGDGDDVLRSLIATSASSYFYGGAGNDTFDTVGGISIYGGEGDDVFNITNGSYHTKAYGEADNDTFNVISGTGATIDGGAGTNTVAQDYGTDTIKVNVDGATAFSVDFAKNETKTLTINGIDYTVTNNNSNAVSFIYEINGEQIKFQSAKFTIKGDVEKAHNVSLERSSIIFYGGNQKDIIDLGASASINSCYAYGLGGDDEIIAGYNNRIYAGDGNDKVTINESNSYVNTGDGDDTVISASYNNGSIVNLGDGNDHIEGIYNKSSIIGGSGTNTSSNLTITNSFVSDLEDSINNGVSVKLEANETKDLIINGVTYTVKNNINFAQSLLYSYNTTTGTLTFGGGYFTINGQSDVSHNVIIEGKGIRFCGGEKDDTIVGNGYVNNIYGQGGNDTMTQNNGDTQTQGGDGDDNITINGAGNVHGNAGNDTFVINVSSTAYKIMGGEGDDTYYINKSFTTEDTGGNNIYYVNTNGASITSGSGNDTFYVTGSNNTIKSGAGDDYFVVDGSSNTLDGGTGSNYIVDNGTGNTPTNIITDPNSGTINFSFVDEVVTRTINEKTYTFTNKGSAINSLSYNLNTNTNTILLSSSGVQIDCTDDEAHILLIRGDNNIVNGGSLSDKITIEQGENNTINGNAGNDIIINDSANNIIYGGANNDTITLNQTASYVDGEGGNDTINVKSDNNAEINAGLGDDKLVISGSNNTIEAQDGNNNINITGSANVVNANDGDNKVVVAGNDNEVTLGNGDNTFGISGDGNTVGSLHTVGNLNINGDENTVVLGNVVQTYSTGSDSAFNGNITVNGNDNVILQEAGNNTVTIKGSGNEYTSNGGEKDITATGSGNALNTSDGNDKITVKGDANTITTTGGNNTLTITGNSNQIQGGTGIDTMKISGNMNTAMGGDGNDSFTLSSGSNNTIDGEGGARNTMVNYSSGINHTNVVDVTPQGFQLDLKVGIGYDENSVISTNIEFNPILLSVDLSSAENALASLASIDDCLKTVSEQLLNIGSIINRLEMVLDEQSIKLENMISSRSTLRDADIAEESSNFIKYQILQEASSTLMASARNLRYENVIGLLQGLSF